jgi:hypothetical protein
MKAISKNKTGLVDAMLFHLFGVLPKKVEARKHLQIEPKKKYPSLLKRHIDSNKI